MALSKNADTQKLFAAFEKETGEICGYIHVPVHERFAALSTMKSIPVYERNGVNAALVYGVLEALDNRLSENGFYIMDGERNINHRTNFQSYLEKYFCFRKAYCKLHMEYNPKLKPVIAICKLIKRPLNKLDINRHIHLINAILKMDECAEHN